jgi:hypothetical protein
MAELWQSVAGTVQRGHQVASGLADDSPYPAGTIALQRPHFAARGLDLSAYYPGTINVSIAPLCFAIDRPAYCFRQVQWTDRHPPEDFSFADCQLVVAGRRYAGLIYYPHPETKAQHFQNPAIVEILAPPIAGISYGMTLELGLNRQQIRLWEAA